MHLVGGRNLFEAEDCSFNFSVFMKLVSKINIETFASHDRGMGINISPSLFYSFIRRKACIHICQTLCLIPGVDFVFIPIPAIRGPNLNKIVVLINIHEV